MDPAAVIIVIYLMAMLALGAWGLRLKGLEDFHLAGRGIKLVLLTGTFCASIIGASATLGMAGLGLAKACRVRGGCSPVRPACWCWRPFLPGK